MVVPLQDAEAVRDVLADSAGHVSLRRVEIRVRVVRRNGVRLVD